MICLWRKYFLIWMLLGKWKTIRDVWKMENKCNNWNILNITTNLLLFFYNKYKYLSRGYGKIFFLFELLVDPYVAVKINIDPYFLHSVSYNITSYISIVQYHNQLIYIDILLWSCSDFTFFMHSFVCVFRSMQFYSMCRLVWPPPQWRYRTDL